MLALAEYLNKKLMSSYGILCFVDITTVQGLSPPFRNYRYGRQTGVWCLVV